MIKREIKETIREYDKDCNLVTETITETVENDDTDYRYGEYRPQMTLLDCGIGETKDGD